MDSSPRVFKTLTDFLFSFSLDLFSNMFYTNSDGEKSAFDSSTQKEEANPDNSNGEAASSSPLRYFSLATLSL